MKMGRDILTARSSIYPHSCSLQRSNRYEPNLERWSSRIRKFGKNTPLRLVFWKSHLRIWPTKTHNTPQSPRTRRYRIIFHLFLFFNELLTFQIWWTAFQEKMLAIITHNSKFLLQWCNNVLQRDNREKRNFLFSLNRLLMKFRQSVFILYFCRLLKYSYEKNLFCTI